MTLSWLFTWLWLVAFRAPRVPWSALTGQRLGLRAKAGTDLRVAHHLKWTGQSRGGGGVINCRFNRFRAWSKRWRKMWMIFKSPFVILLKLSWNPFVGILDKNNCLFCIADMLMLYFERVQLLVCCNSCSFCDYCYIYLSNQTPLNWLFQSLTLVLESISSGLNLSALHRTVDPKSLKFGGEHQGLAQPGPISKELPGRSQSELRILNE